ncbi:hypothetical protein [Streptomyces klenkii]|uniref:hypothetical protein n=1 Tax=Streptomyces klenkii TaxID=1420899 RepID=UPI0018F32ACE|nr:hypothetical protein [Streptomyces klenkii]
MRGGGDGAALDIAAELIGDLGGVPAVIGGLERARQLEDVAGFVMGWLPRATTRSPPCPSSIGHWTDDVAHRMRCETTSTHIRQHPSEVMQCRHDL